MLAFSAWSDLLKKNQIDMPTGNGRWVYERIEIFLNTPEEQKKLLETAKPAKGICELFTTTATLKKIGICK